MESVQQGKEQRQSEQGRSGKVEHRQQPHKQDRTTTGQRREDTQSTKSRTGNSPILNGAGSP